MLARVFLFTLGERVYFMILILVLHTVLSCPEPSLSGGDMRSDVVLLMVWSMRGASSPGCSSPPRANEEELSRVVQDLQDLKCGPAHSMRCHVRCPAAIRQGSLIKANSLILDQWLPGTRLLRSHASTLGVSSTVGMAQIYVMRNATGVEFANHEKIQALRLTAPSGSI